uniref:Uncharacterized protein n=1 Tax=Siphoviridae sp. cteEQ43 TaxID=2827905 RepID=A0A8S5TCB2_9CAUD|nr:MAG TPA: hypothetical protein [Siphoviridae sp. cteEQ43]
MGLLQCSTDLRPKLKLSARNGETSTKFPQGRRSLYLSTCLEFQTKV